MPVDPNLVGSHLENILKQRPQTTTHYGSVAQAFGLPDFDGAWASHPLSEIFEVIDQQDAVANRPFRTSVVILKNQNCPGPGFFEAMRRLKGAQDPVTENARERMWLSELTDAYAYPWP